MRHSGGQGARITMTGDDVAVGVASTVALTQPWWGPFFTIIPDIGQGIIIIGTVVYVLARAVNEVRKLWGGRS